MPCNILSCAFPCCLGQVRYMVVFLLFIGIIVSNTHRSVLNIAIVEMVSNRKTRNGTTCPSLRGSHSVITDIGGGKIDWSESEQQLVIAAFFPLYFIMHVPGGIMMDRFGARHVLMWCFIISSVTTAMIPMAARHFPWWAVFIIRLITGASQGPLIPGVSAVVSRWIPPQERATVGAMVFAANAFGILSGNLITGTLIRAVKDWQIPFYMWAGIGMVYVILYIGYVFSDPRTSPFLTSVELNYLTELMTFKEPAGIPLGPILKDLCVWGLVSAQVGHGFVIFTLQNNLPKYLNNVLGFDIVSNALTALLFIFQWLSGMLAGMLSDHLVKKKNANVSWMRKIYTAVSNILSSLFLLFVGMAQCNIPIAISMLGIAIFLKGIFFAGMKVNIVDISVNHSALVMAVVNGIGAIPGFLCSFIISKVAPNNAHEEWFYVFLGMLGIQVLTSLIYLILSGTDRRKWDYKEGEQPPPKKKAKHWYLQMSPSDDAIRVENNKKAVENRKANAVAAKARMAEEYKASIEAKKAAKQAARSGT